MSAVIWLSLALVLYVYLAYPAALHLLAKRRRLRFPQPPEAEPTPAVLPSITLIIPAHNEEKWIRQKLQNTLALDYPRERLQILVASDGSTDATVAVARQFALQGVEVAAFAERQGKQEMLNILAPQARGEVLVMTDTHVLLQPDSVRRLVRRFADPQVGCVTGTRRCVVQPGVPQGAGEGWYWRYESWIKQNESRLHSCLGAHGQLYAVRKSVFPKVAKVGEDFYIPMKVIAATGLRVIYEPEAVAYTPAAANLKIEFERKTRAHVSFLLTLPLLPELWRPHRSPVWWQYWSHHVLRMAVPPALLTVGGCSCILAVHHPAYRLLVAAQGLFYAFAAAGAWLARHDIRWKLFYFPFYFVFANLALANALWRWPRRKYDHAWQRTERIPVADGQIAHS
jgi:poly-beta-1,6-N-acetyl-D-glucosamine synthase